MFNVFHKPRKTIISLGISSLIVILFFELIPISFLSNWKFLLATVGGLAFSLSIGSFLFSMKTRGSSKKSRDALNSFKGFLAILSLFAFGFTLIYKVSHFEGNELSNNGLPTSGMVTSKFFLPGKTSTSYEATISYKDENGVVHKADALISKDEYGRIQDRQTVPIVYSPNYPNIIRIDFRRLKILN